MQSDRTMETGLEFGCAGQGCRLLFTAFHQFLKDTKEHSLSGRLVSKLLKVVQSDPVHDLGQRRIGSGDLSLLEGFDFYLKHPLLRLLPGTSAILVDRKKGKCLVNITPFVPKEWMPEAVTATHITITGAVAELDFEQERFITNTSNSVPLPVKELATLTLNIPLPKSSPLPLVVVVGLQFQKVVNGKAYPMAGRALQVVKVEKAEKAKGIKATRQRARR